MRRKRNLLIDGSEVSDAFAHAAMSRATIGIAQIAPDGRWLSVNDALCELLGRAREALLGTDFRSITHPDDLAADLALMARFAAGKSDPARFEKRFVAIDGRAIWVDMQVAPLFEGGRLVDYLVTMLDITERKHQEAANHFLADVVAPLSTLVDYRSTLQSVAGLAVPFLADWCVIDVADETGRLQRVANSHAAPEMTDLVHRLSFDYSPAGASITAQILERRESRCLNGVTDVERRLLARNSEQLAMLHSLEPHGFLGVPLVIRDRAVGIMAFFSGPSGRVFTDTDIELAERVADRVSVALENARLYQSVRLADERKDVYLATLSHELRNPLGAISNGLGLLRPNCSDEESRWAFGMIERQMGNLTHLLDDLLDISRITQGKVRLERGPVPLDGVIRNSISAVSARLSEREHRFVTELAANGVVLDADAARLEQVVVNLLTNAIRYTDPGGTITLATSLEEGEVAISVTDTGDGILAGDIDDVFDLFTQFSREGRDGADGLGLGLTLVQQLVKLHGGNVEASSEGKDRGSRFTVRLPLGAGEVSSLAGSGESDAASAPAVPLDTVVGAAARYDILLVDDNIDALDAMVRFLERAGHRVRSASDGRTAIEAVAERRPDLMLLDIGLPDISGHEVARTLRADPDNAAIRLIALTGYGRDSDRELSREAGFDEHLVKPLRLAALVKLLDALGSAR